MNEAAKVLQTESSVNLNYIEDRRDFDLKVTSGQWDQVLEEMFQLNLPQSILSDVHEQVKFIFLLFIYFVINIYRFLMKCWKLTNWKLHVPF